jgi:hypothetical protein
VIELLLEAERALAVGLLDKAERLYRQSAEADPRNSIAVVGLARVALERDDEPNALQLGERALAIDPDNLVARRLVDRLVAVRAHRGGPLAESGAALAAGSAADVAEAAAAAAGGVEPAADVVPISSADVTAVEVPSERPDTPDPARNDAPEASPPGRSFLRRLFRRN